MYTFDINADNFQELVINKSQQTLVLADFWAPWCGPCKILKPLLEKLAIDYQGKFVLAKINSDENQSLAGQFGIRGIPTVKAIFQGQVVSEFSGALPETEVRAFIDALLPSPSDELVATAMITARNGKNEKAEELLQKAIEIDPQHTPAKIELAHLYLKKHDVSGARKLLDAIPQADKFNAAIQALESKVVLAEQSQNLPDLKVLQSRVDANAHDLQARLDLANLYIAHERFEEAIKHLLEITRQDKQFSEDIARRTLLNIFNLLGNQDELVRSSRKKLAVLLN